jgi:phospholipid/cholesterol/gamma-HCH transport system permease protein
MGQDAWLKHELTRQTLYVNAGGSWVIANAAPLDEHTRRLTAAGADQAKLDLSAIQQLDTVGAWLLFRTVKSLRDHGCEVDLTGARREHAALIRTVSESFQASAIAPRPAHPVRRFLEHLGKSAINLVLTADSFVSFFGRAFLVMAHTALRPRRLRATSVVYHMEEVGINALPIVGLMSFLIGIVLVYQGALQLQRFGAEIFVVDLLSLSVLRELGVLLTAIIIAGRSGSAFAAQLGSMKLHEEVDAMRVLGMDPVEVLVLPRVLALTITLPLLAFVADIMGLLGGALMCWAALDITPDLFVARLNEVTGLKTFWVGILKAPVFAVLIGLIGCYEGLQVEGGAESVGRHTTSAVVEAIFLVIVADALFSIFFGIVGI